METTTKECPYCKEEVKKDATTCKHCGKEISKTVIIGTAMRSLGMVLILGTVLVAIIICLVMFLF